jgi:hypothetical protein
MQIKELGREAATYLIIATVGVLLCFVPLLLSVNQDWASFSRYVTNTLITDLLPYWILSVCILISLRFRIFGYIICGLCLAGIVLSAITEVPRYLVMSKLGLISTYFTIIFEPLFRILTIIIAVILMCVTKNRSIAYFIPVTLLTGSNLFLNIHSILRIYNVPRMHSIHNLIFALVFVVICIMPYFIETPVRMLFKSNLIKRGAE